MLLQATKQRWSPDNNSNTHISRDECKETIMKIVKNSYEYNFTDSISYQLIEVPKKRTGKKKKNSSYLIK